METKTQNGNHSGWKAAGRAASFMLLPQWFFSEASGAARDAGRLAGMVASVFQSTTDPDEMRIGPDWDSTMIMHQFSESELRQQVHTRQILACFCYVAALANFGAAFLYAPIGWITGSLFAVWYLQNVLAICQIRVHWFCTFFQYIRACARYPWNLLPIGLTRDWRMLDEEPGKELAL